MNFDKILNYSFATAKDAIAGTWVQEYLPVVARILLFLMLPGYRGKVCRGEKTTPKVTGRGTLFIDGTRYLVVSLIRILPAKTFSIF